MTADVAAHEMAVHVSTTTERARDVRDRVLPLPGRAEGYRRVLLLGTTGAGKTTLLRQLIGTHPTRERFPSTSTAKTTVAETEIVLGSGPYQAVVTFAERVEVAEALRDNVVAAARAAADGESDADVARHLLDHVSQRWRFSYVLGRGPFEVGPSAATGDWLSLSGEPTAGPDSARDRDAGSLDEGDDMADRHAPTAARQEDTDALLRRTVAEIAELAREHAWLLNDPADGRGESDTHAAAFEEAVAADRSTAGLVASLLDEMAARFDQLEVGGLNRDPSGWPIWWAWATEDRGEFLAEVGRMSSNRHEWFGSLLTPLVSGIRVRGPFYPRWAEEERAGSRLVLIDGEGLGHTPSSAGSLSTAVLDRFADVDRIVVVDNAEQPMQAAPLAALRAIVTTGNVAKLSVCFTHLDRVRGDNIASFDDACRHVRASADNAVSSLSRELPHAERAMRQRLGQSGYYVGLLDRRLEVDSKVGRSPGAAIFRGELQRLLAGLTTDALGGGLVAEASLPRPRRADWPAHEPFAESLPGVVDLVTLTTAMSDAAEDYLAQWRARLGIEPRPGVYKEHWARVKALTRRLGLQMGDEYDDLRPVAELQSALQEVVYEAVSEALGVPVDDRVVPEALATTVDTFAAAVAEGLHEVCERRIWTDRVGGWAEAYEPRGPGSTRVRSYVVDRAVLSDAVYRAREDGRPELGAEVTEVLLAAAAEAGLEMRA